VTENEQLLARVAAAARPLHTSGRTAVPEPVDAETLSRAEASLGFSLPPLLAEIYLRVGDGGFGPEYGLLPLLDDPPGGEPAAVTQYLANRDSRRHPAWPWPEGVLPISHWGCSMYACVDCLTPGAPVLLFEPNAGDPDCAWYVDALSLADWLHGWLDGTGWYDRVLDELDMAPWADFGARTARASE
jgi:hypothetical protein